jgi:membrane-associated phospholipid phosphatase
MMMRARLSHSDKTSDIFWASLWSLCLISFIALGVRAARGGVLEADLHIVRWVQKGPPAVGWLSDFANGVNGALPLAAIIVLACGLLLRRHLLLEAVLVAATLLVRLLQDGAKYVFDEPRPLPDLVRVTEFPGSPSYPSGHVTGTATLFVLLFAFAPLIAGPRFALVLRVFCVFMVGWISIARMWVGAHWPTDCLGGYLFAALYLIPSLVLRSHQRSK